MREKRVPVYLAGAFLAVNVFCLTSCGESDEKVESESVGAATVKPRGDFAQVDARLANETIRILAKGGTEERQNIIAKIKANPEDYAPPVFYALSNVLFAEGKKDEGVFWFYAGQLRARVDASICADSSAMQAVGILNHSFGMPINQYAFQNVPKLEALIPRVVDWERKTPYNYDRRWINLHGMDAMMSGSHPRNKDTSKVALSLPEEKWNEIAEKTRTDYLSDFRQAITQMKNRVENGIEDY